MLQTTNYQLKKWEKSDRILMDDFNQNNDKIDSTLKQIADSSNFVKLKEVTTTEEQAQIDIDFSDLDMTQYTALKAYITVNTMQFSVRVNNRTANYGGENFSESSSYREYLVLSQNVNPSSRIQAELSLSGLSPSSWTALGFLVSTAGTKVKGSLGTASFAQPLAQLNRVAVGTNPVFKAGSTVQVYGIRA